MGTKITIPEMMTRFVCNQQGCCCEGWQVSFEPEELVPLLRALEDDERETVMDGIRFWAKPDGTVTKFSLQPEPGDPCSFLAADKRCRLHAEKGVEVLPYLCRAFPAFGRKVGDRVELHYDAVCPEVLNQLAEDDQPFRTVDIEVDEGSNLGYRASRLMRPVAMHIGARELEEDELNRIRATCLETIEASDLPAIDLLGVISYAMADFATDPDADQFRFLDVPADSGFETFFDGCVRVHSATALARIFDRYKRFVYTLDISEAQWATVGDQFRFDPTWPDRFDIRDPRWQPMLKRYLAHRIYSAFDRSPAANMMAFTYGTIVHCFGTVVRYVDGLSRWLEIPIDREVLMLALGASEYLYRSVRTPPLSMPWFGIEIVEKERGKD